MQIEVGKTMVTVAISLTVLAGSIRLHAQISAQTTGYPQRAPADPAVLERGRLLYSTSCAFCHGSDARGGEGGPNLLRSEIVLNDSNGELLGDILRNGVGAMPKFELNNDQVSDIAAFVHSFRVGGYDVSRLRPETIVVGDAKAGETYFKAKCASCHDVGGDLKGFSARVADSRVMQQTWLMPGARGTRPSRQPATSVVVKLASGQTIEGRLVRIDDFIVTLTTADETQHTIRRDGETSTVEVRDPLQGHRDLLRTYADRDIHNVTAYLESLK